MLWFALAVLDVISFHTAAVIYIAVVVAAFAVQVAYAILKGVSK